MQPQEMPYWVTLLQSDSDAKASFEKWIDDHILELMYRFSYAARDWHEVLGIRYMLSEWEAMREFLNFDDEEIARLMNYGGEQLDELVERNGNGYSRPAAAGSGRPNPDDWQRHYEPIDPVTGRTADGRPAGDW